MSLSDRDKKIAMVMLPLVLIGAFVFFVMKPKRAEAVQAAKALEEQRESRDKAVAREQQLLVAKQTFTADYTTVVRLGKAVPTDVDMPSVLVQLERAAKGTGIEFGKITPGPRVPATGGAASGAAPSGGAAAGSSSAQPVAAGGASAQSGAGQNVEKANTAAAGSGQASAASQNAAPQAGAPASTPPAGGASGATAVPGLDTVPLELGFTGSFFDLADFFHDLKRFVDVANQDLKIRGRLLTIDSFSFKSESFPKLEAEMKARIFLSPPASGAAAGASPAGPAAPGSSASAQASDAPTATPTTAAAPGVATP
jgi:Tfp pilus assembly protein PilO